MAPGASRFTFVDNGRLARDGPNASSSDRNIVRSHAMQTVWNQRNQDQKNQTKKKLEIVVETKDSYDRKECNKANSARRRQASAVLQVDGDSDYPKNSGKGYGDAESSGEASSDAVIKRESGNGDQHQTATQHEHAAVIKFDIQRESGNGDQDQTATQHEHVAIIKFDIQRDVAWQQEIDMAIWGARANKRMTMDTLAVGMLDPFQMACSRIDSRMNAYLHHYFNALSWKFTMPKKVWLRSAMEDPGLLHSVLFVASAHYGFATNKSRTLTTDAKKHAAAAIACLKDCLQDPKRQASDQALGTIARLITWSLIQGDQETFAKHMKHVDKMVRMRGGLDCLGMKGQLRYFICATVFGGASIWMDDIPEAFKYPYGPLDYSALDDVQSKIPLQESTASSFVALEDAGWLPQDLIHTCIAMARMDALIAHPRNPFRINEDAQASYGHTSNKLALRLIYASQRETRRFEAGEINVHTCIIEITRTSVLCYLMAYQRDIPLFSLPIPEALKRIQVCVQALEMFPKMKVSDAWGRGRLGQLLLWILLVAGSVTIHPMAKQAIGQQLRIVQEKMGIKGWKHAQEICRTFLWQESTCGKKCLDFWHEVFYFQVCSPRELTIGPKKLLADDEAEDSGSTASRDPEWSIRRAHTREVEPDQHLPHVKPQKKCK